jgi:hypothetical protein
MNNFELHHVAHGMSLIRYSESRPDARDLISDPELWRAVYFEHRDEVLARFGTDCEATRRFEPELLQDDDQDDDSDDLDSDEE